MCCFRDKKCVIFLTVVNFPIYDTVSLKNKSKSRGFTQKDTIKLGSSYVASVATSGVCRHLEFLRSAARWGLVLAARGFKDKGKLLTLFDICT